MNRWLEILLVVAAAVVALVWRNRSKAPAFAASRRVLKTQAGFEHPKSGAVSEGGQVLDGASGSTVRRYGTPETRQYSNPDIPREDEFDIPADPPDPLIGEEHSDIVWKAPLALGVLLLLLVGWSIQLARSSRIPVAPTRSVQAEALAQAPAFFQAYQCGTCHVIPGIRDAVGHVGPTLAGFGNRTYVAGAFPNSPDVVVRWIRFPQELRPGSAMPNLLVAEPAARAMAEYLFNLR